MTERKAEKTKEKIKRLKIKKETLKDLGTADGKARAIKGGYEPPTRQNAVRYC